MSLDPARGILFGIGLSVMLFWLPLGYVVFVTSRKGLRMNLSMLLLVFGFVLIVLAALNVPSSRVHLGWAGVACLVARLFL